MNNSKNKIKIDLEYFWKYFEKYTLGTIAVIWPFVLTGVIVFSLIKLSINNNASFEQVKVIVDILAWPIVVFISLLFFRKVITYLFFSMEEFNFFGARGNLKNVSDVIEEGVEKRLEEIKSTEEQNKKHKKIIKEKEELENKNLNWEQKFKKQSGITDRIFELYEKLLRDFKEQSKELEDYRKEESDRRKRIERIRERNRFYRNKRFNLEKEPTQEEIDSAGDQYTQEQEDIKIGK